jgi:EAL domain-containing protein (putative c-di-GMP-specific phosphodiesterase class I)
MGVLAQRLAAVLPPGALLATPGEGEFAFVLDGAGLEAATVHARAALALRAAPVEASNAIVEPCLAIGIALYPGHAVDADSLARRASAAMHLAQHASFGIRVYRCGHEQEVTARLALMGRLRRAIDHGEFELYCQPKIDMRSGCPSGAEALIRWRDPVHGLVGPATFIPLAEQGGLIAAITEWMVVAAFRTVRGWHDDGMRFSLSVNLSVHDIQDPLFVDRIRDLAAAMAVPAGAVQFELTESALMDDPDTAMQSLVRLNDMGFQIWIDDFGTGYSSLSYLQRFPIHAIKIDQSFVRAMGTSTGSRAIVDATIDLGHHLGLEVVAEGVEDRDAWYSLAAQGCDVVQGYFVAQPMPVAQFAHWSTQWHPVR